MLIIPGGRALSDFNQSKLLKNLRREIPAIESVEAQYQHFADVSTTLSEQDNERLESLLSYGEEQFSESPKGFMFLVTPRPGTISPWSSKATDIVHNCGLLAVTRVERARAYYIACRSPFSIEDSQAVALLLHDRMMEVVVHDMDLVSALFSHAEPEPLNTVVLGADPQKALNRANAQLGLALSNDEVDYLADSYAKLQRDPTDVELMMFAQANSEHCRHKIFNADWVIDGQVKEQTLFGMIRNTHKCSPEGVLTAYSDNSSVIEGPVASRFFPKPGSHDYAYHSEPVHLLMKVETHNHPTAISPFPGAATGSGGEIRDEGATGNGSKPKAGLCGFSVSNLRIPEYDMPWERDFGRPSRIDSALNIMLDGPIGAAAFNNEFGRPNLCGYFRTFEAEVPGPNGLELRGYHKPIMLAGGLGNIRPDNLHKKELPEGTPIIVLGGPAMLIGLGGGAASSMASGTSTENLDFASVQRGNPEMERRCQEVIDRCVALGDISPILSIHDVGAGGISNAIPEIINDAGRGGKFQLRDIPNAEMGMAPMEIWCNEAQERYVMAVAVERLAEFEAICQRERAVYAVVGFATEDQHLQVSDSHFENNPVDMPLDVLLGKPPKMLRDVTSVSFVKPTLELADIELAEAINRVLSLPTVASKAFLITIGDRSITGMVNRDQMVGPWQVPVADVAVTATDYRGYTGEAMAIGERTPLALVNPAASGRMAIGEAITNIAAANINKLSDMVLSANWMAAAGHNGEDAALFETVQAVGEEICPKLGICIPVGKDSLSMKTVWQQDDEPREMTSPLSLIVTSFSVVKDIRNTLTPQLRTDKGDTRLILIDLGKGENRMAASVLSQVYNRVGDVAPDFQDADMMLGFFDALQRLNESGKLLAYHDRSDGGLLTTLIEMAFAGRTGIDVQLANVGAAAVNDSSGDSAKAAVLEVLFNEELGAVIQVKQVDVATVMEVFAAANLQQYVHDVGVLNHKDSVEISLVDTLVYSESRAKLQQIWSQVSYRMQSLRDNTDCADQEFERIADVDDAGLFSAPTFDIDEDVAAALIKNTPFESRPKVAILREQGVNGQIEMAAAFDKAGFQAIDVHMTDILSGLVSLAEFKGLVACGGFSYGDVLGAGGGWAKTILFNKQASQAFSDFFQRDDTFVLGVCNGCQMLSQLKHMIPGAAHWPAFYRNHSEQFEARVSMVEVMDSPSVFLAGMQGSKLPIAVAHGEGRAVFDSGIATGALIKSQKVTLCYVNANGDTTEHYPENPNGSADGITGLCSDDGRVTIMMPHPERVCRKVTNSWHPDEWAEDGPWMRMFRNARCWVA